MNKKKLLSNLSHAFLVVLCQAFSLLFCSISIPSLPIVLSCTLGSLFGVGFYLGREVAQHERKMGTPPWYSGFKFWEWSLDSKLDLLFPIIVGILSPTVCQLIV